MCPILILCIISLISCEKREHCYKCFDTKEVECTECFGDGKLFIRCSKCYGNGYIKTIKNKVTGAESREECSSCKGTGGSTLEGVNDGKCYTCDGTGRIPCLDCSKKE